MDALLQTKSKEQLYVDVKTDENINSLEKHVENMCALHTKYLKSPEDQNIIESLKLEKLKVFEIVLSLKMLLEEAQIDKLISVSSKILGATENFNIEAQDYSRFSDAMAKFIRMVRLRHEIDNQAAGRLWNNIKMGYYPTDETNLMHIKRAIEFPTDIEVNLLDPCCGCATAIAQLGEGNNALLYGIELDEARAESARKKLTRLGKGSFFGSRISHEAFHMMYLNPPYLTIYSDGFNVRAEKRFLVESICHIMYGGLLVYVIPYYRLTPDIARILADNFEQLRVFKFIGAEFNRFKQVAIFGIRKAKASVPKEVGNLIRQVTYPESIPGVDEIPDRIYSLPKKPVNVQLFKGAVFDVQELAEQLEATGLLSNLYRDNELDNTDKRPLIPFTIGQIGLIGGSGLIDGLIDCDYPHILKGQVIKTKKIVEEKDDDKGNRTSYTEQIVNKMNLKVLTPQGKVITLA